MSGLMAVDHYMMLNKRQEFEQESALHHSTRHIESMTEQEFEEVYGCFTDAKDEED